MSINKNGIYFVLITTSLKAKRKYMKKLMVISFLVFAGLLPGIQSSAQVHVSINIGDQPAWAPEGYDDAAYYYIPDMDIYYYVPTHQFIYLQNRHWVRTTVLPAQYRKYDLYKVHKVAINKPDAYKYHRQDRVQYAQYRGKFDQTPIRDSHDDKYKNNHDNWNNNRFRRGHDNGHGGHGH
ncbi:MAG TPA: hypothetical protein VG847_09395 [Chitinophagaceae bacterium]|nr:hypothetical protein [Chitinophagaceae bacterium]